MFRQAQHGAFVLQLVELPYLPDATYDRRIMLSMQYAIHPSWNTIGCNESDQNL